MAPLPGAGRTARRPVPAARFRHDLPREAAHAP